MTRQLGKKCEGRVSSGSGKTQRRMGRATSLPLAVKGHGGPAKYFGEISDFVGVGG